MARLFIAIVALFLAGVPIAARAQAPFGLSLDRIGEVEPGTYLAGDNVRFTLNSNGDTYLLRFDGNPEVYVLYAGHASLGGRILKYDSGETAMQVAGWGGITLYTDATPNGLPAERTGDAAPVPALPAVSLNDLQKAANDEIEHLAYMRGLRMTVSADWNALANNADLRASVFDAMENAVRGLDRFSYKAAGREALAHHVDLLRIEAANRPTLTLKLKTLIVTFNPDRGYEGRASSRAIARALGEIFSRK
jgi:Domain of unknown function (DUF4908)